MTPGQTDGSRRNPGPGRAQPVPLAARAVRGGRAAGGGLGARPIAAAPELSANRSGGRGSRDDDPGTSETRGRGLLALLAESPPRGAPAPGLVHAIPVSLLSAEPLARVGVGLMPTGRGWGRVVSSRVALSKTGTWALSPHPAPVWTQPTPGGDRCPREVWPGAWAAGTCCRS